MDKKFIVIEGPIGVGKTTLAQRIAESNGAELLQDPEAENPFLEDFYNKSGSYALHTQLDFLLRRHELMASLEKRHSEEMVVCDFLMDKDRLFAEHTLTDDEFRIYEKVASYLPELTQKPDLLIYLQAPTATLLDRIETRGLVFEQHMASGYLQRLSDAYSVYFHEYSESPLLIVNATEIDFVNNNEDYENLLAQIGEISAGRHYLNPLPA